MSREDFLLPKVDGKLDVKTPSRWYISDRMLAEEFVHFAEKRGVKSDLIDLIYHQLMRIHHLNMPSLQGCVTVSNTPDAPAWVQDLVKYLAYKYDSEPLPTDIDLSAENTIGVFTPATNTAIPSPYDVLARLLVAVESDEFIRWLSAYMQA